MSGISKRVSGSWVSGNYGIMGTATDTLTTLPAVLYPNDTTATVGLKGNMSQTGTPTPQNPIQPSECGDLETVGEKAGQYKIPISSANTTTPIYLGEVQTTRKIKKLVLTGEETVQTASGNAPYRISVPGLKIPTPVQVLWMCSHYQGVPSAASWAQYNSLISWNGGDDATLRFRDTSKADANAFKAFLSSEYSNGTPVTIWYVLATEETGIVNEPIRKIGDYADTVSGITIPTIAGANSFDVLTTLQPSEVTATYKGWHPVQSVHERENGAWT